MDGIPRAYAASRARREPARDHEQEPHVLGRVARLHYEHGLTHQQIADALGLSRVKVTRLLAEARRTGVVEVRIHSDETLFTDLEVALTERYGLHQTWIAPTRDDLAQQLTSLGAVGAMALRAAVRADMTIAVGLSTTVSAIVAHLKVDEPLDLRFVPATGSPPGSGDGPSAQEIARALATAVGGRAHQLPAPILAASTASAELLRQEPDVAATLALAREADVAVFGIGGTTPGAGLLMDGSVPATTIAALVDAGAVGGISAGFFDATGSPVRTELEARIIGISLAELARIPVRIAVAGGVDKRAALAGALAGHHLDVLVTDEDTARDLLAR